MVQDFVLLMFLAVTAGLLLWIAVTDIRIYKISNKASLSIAVLFLPVFFLTGPTWSGAGLHLVAAAAALGLGFAMFSVGLLGGGDAKLFSAVALWAGVEHILMILFIMAMTGGLLAVVYIVIGMVRRSAQRKNLAAAAAASSSEGVSASKKHKGQKKPQGLLMTPIPYGVAIAAAQLWLVVEIARPLLEKHFGA